MTIMIIEEELYVCFTSIVEISDRKIRSLQSQVAQVGYHYGIVKAL